MESGERPAAATAAKDRREDPRFPVDVEASLTIHPNAQEPALAVRLINVSTSGICFESGQSFAPGTFVRIRVQSRAAIGEVRYCHQAASGAYRCGVDVISFR